MKTYPPNAKFAVRVGAGWWVSTRPEGLSSSLVAKTDRTVFDSLAGAMQLVWRWRECDPERVTRLVIIKPRISFADRVEAEVAKRVAESHETCEARIAEAEGKGADKERRRLADIFGVAQRWSSDEARSMFIRSRLGLLAGAP